MKKLVILSMVFIFAMSAAQAQMQKKDKEKVKETKKELRAERVALRKLEGNLVSDESKAAFSADFPGAKNVVSERVDTYDEFAFTDKNGQKKKAFYDAESKLVGTTQFKTFADLPASGQKEIKKEYKDYTIGQVVFFADNQLNDTDMIMYGIQFDDADNYFVELAKGSKKIVLQVNPEGDVFFFKEL
jgi:hypothetical protein